MHSYQVCVVGVGQMGQGIAQVCAQAGHQVTLVDADLARAEAALLTVTQRLNRLHQKGNLSTDLHAKALAGLRATSVEVGAVTADFVLEAVSENEALKCALFGQLDALAPARALLCSNTSSISITKLASATTRPSQVVGVHFMNPVPLMPLVELVRGLETSEATLEQAQLFARGLGKTTVTSRDTPGFIVNRLLIPMLNEACLVLQEGVASVQNIDQAMQLGLHHPMGPLRLADLIGLDTVLAIAEVLHRELGEDKYRPAPLLRTMVAANYLGNKTNLGFYDYRVDAKNPEPNRSLQR